MAAEVLEKNTVAVVDVVELASGPDAARRGDNSADLAAQIESIYCADARAAFDDPWRKRATRTEHLVAQVTANQDEDYVSAARTEPLAAGLGDAIADQFPRMFSDTSMGSCAPGRERPVGPR